MLDKGTIERAFELAGSGDARSLDDVTRQLRKEQYEAVSLHLSGPLVRRQLRDLIDRSRMDTFSLEGREADAGAESIVRDSGTDFAQKNNAVTNG